MKKKLMCVLAMLLCVVFCFAGCALFPQDENQKSKQEVISNEKVTLTQEEFVKGYNNYYSTFYNQADGDADEATEQLIKYLVAKKLYLQDAEKLIESGDIVLTKTEQNYLWNKTLSSMISNIESFEEDVKESLGLDEENSEDEDEKEQESDYIYTAFSKQATIEFNEQKNQYEIVVRKQVLVKDVDENGKETYEYVDEKDADGYDDSNLVLYTINYVFEGIENEKLFKDKTDLTAEETQQKVISQEALRRYLTQLKENEEGKNLSTENKEVLQREIERIYQILRENLLVSKLNDYKSNEVSVSEEDFLNYYLSKVIASHDRYSADTEEFIEELTKTIGSAKYWGSSSNCIENVYYIPETDEEFFYINHIVVSLTEEQIDKINALKTKCESNELSDEYYNEEFYKIVPKIDEETISKVIDLLYDKENLSDEQYEEKLLEIIGSKLLLVDERDSEGYVTKEVMTVQEMIASLYKDLAEIHVKYYGQTGNSITLNGRQYTPTQDGLITVEKAKEGGGNKLTIEQLETNYLAERGDKFNEYIYKYTDDTGVIQIQNTFYSYYGTNENWYTYVLGSSDTDNSFVENFVEAARELNSRGEVTAVKTILMENWKTTDGKEVLQSQSTAFSTIIYGGKVSNLFSCFDDEKFTLNDLLNEETENGYAKYYSLLKMDEMRLGITGNKTLFDKIFEEYYEAMYDEVTQKYEDEILKDVDLTPNQSIVDEIIG